MTSLSQQKAVSAVFLMTAVILLAVPDMIFGVLLELIGFVFELSLIWIEYIEIFLEYIVEHVFETEQKQTQVIVFYLLSSAGVLALYYVWKGIFYVLLNIKAAFVASFYSVKSELSNYWAEVSVLTKIKYALLGFGGLTLLMMIGV